MQPITEIPPSIPEPPPKNKGVEVPPLLLEWLSKQESIQVEYSAFISEEELKQAMELVQARTNYGIHKYGMPLKTQDGRDSQEDAVQEIGDALQYLYKARLNGENIDKIKHLMSVLLLLVFDDADIALKKKTIHPI